jgi:hypothetical protein
VTVQELLGHLSVALVVVLAAGGALTGVVAALSDPQIAVGGAFTLALVVGAVRYGGTRAGGTASVYW